MAYSNEKIKEWFDFIITEIEKGKSLRSTLSTNGAPSSSTFYIWLEDNEELSKRYARACQYREEKLFDEILEIADKQGSDVISTDAGEFINHNVIHRNRLQIDARKWMLSKMNPKKYGDKVDVTSQGEKIQQPQAIPIVLQDGRTFEDLKNELQPE